MGISYPQALQTVPYSLTLSTDVSYLLVLRKSQSFGDYTLIVPLSSAFSPCLFRTLVPLPGSFHTIGRMAASASYATPQHTSSAQPAPANPGNHATLHKDGYPSLAFFFSQNSRYLHLRKFSALAIRVLLYRQYKLTRLEKDLLHLEQRDAEKNPNILKDFALIESESRSSGVPPEATQCWLYEELQNELKEYGRHLGAAINID